MKRDSELHDRFSFQYIICELNVTPLDLTNENIGMKVKV